MKAEQNVTRYLFHSLPQLIVTLVHYPCTVALPGLTNWCPRVSFANHVKSLLRQWAFRKVQDGRYGYEIGPRVKESSLRPSRLAWVNGWNLFNLSVTVTASAKTLHVSGHNVTFLQSFKFHKFGPVHCNIKKVYSLMAM